MYIRLSFTIEFRPERYQQKECSKSQKNCDIIHELLEHKIQEHFRNALIDFYSQWCVFLFPIFKKRCRSPPLVLRFRKSTKIKEDKPMAKPYKIPDFRKLYPKASEEVIAVLRTTERKMQYQEFDLKTERTLIDQESQTVIVIPSREDSLERLLEQNVQFEEKVDSAEEQALRNIQIKQLHRALSLLSEDERLLIEQIFFEERTEREIAAETGIYHNAVHKRKERILSKLKKILENF